MKFNSDEPPQVAASRRGIASRTATPSFALFGIGDIVFDPTSYASLVSQLTTLQTQYNMLKNNITHFSFKQQWQTTLTCSEERQRREYVRRDRRHEHRAQHQLAGRIHRRHGRRPRVPVNSNATTYLQGQTLGKRAAFAARHDRDVRFRLSRLPYGCGPVPGSEKPERNGQQLAALSSSSTAATATNSEVQQLNLLNAAEAQKLTEMQSQGTLQACLASQMTVANMQQRNAAARGPEYGGLRPAAARRQ